MLEERIEGTECSLIALCDGVTSVALPIAQYHKRVGEGDTGPNTGGMGAYAPVPIAHDPAHLKALFIDPIVDHFAKIGTPYVGALFAGIMLTNDGPKLLEYNCRFGDPEAQVLLPLIDTDFVSLLLDCCTHTLQPERVSIRNASALAVVIAAENYPNDPTLGDSISGIPTDSPFCMVAHGGTEQKNG